MVWIHHKTGIQSSRERCASGETGSMVRQFENLPLLRSQMSEMPLHKRIWQCPECGVEHDRDINAALNIKRKGILELQAAGLVVSAHGGQRKSVTQTVAA